MSRPEHTAPPEIFYGEDEARKYTQNSRIAAIQATMALRALELLALPPTIPALLLDVGCGSGLSGEILDEEGHTWVGVDIAPHMLAVAREREVDGDLLLGDMGQGCGYLRPGVFDGAVSVSALQWLCNADKSSHVPRQRMTAFFTTLYSALRRGARAVFQLYPENDQQLDMIMKAATKCGFTGGLVVDYPNSNKARKFYLCLFAGRDPSAAAAGDKQTIPQGLSGDGEDAEMLASASTARFETRRRDRAAGRERRHGRKDKPMKNGKEWILHKKELNKTRGKEVPNDSKYTGRKRRTRF